MIKNPRPRSGQEDFFVFQFRLSIDVTFSSDPICAAKPYTLLIGGLRGKTRHEEDIDSHVGRCAGSPTACERVGLVYSSFGPDVARLVKTVVSAEVAGVRQVWCTKRPVQDTLTAFAAAAVHTRNIRLGTAIIPAYSRHPLTMVAQALALDELAPGRLRLGIGSSHRPIIEGTHGIKMVKPLEYLREYVQVCTVGSMERQGRS